MFVSHLHIDLYMERKVANMKGRIENKEAITKLPAGGCGEPMLLQCWWWCWSWSSCPWIFPSANLLQI